MKTAQTKKEPTVFSLAKAIKILDEKIARNDAPNIWALKGRRKKLEIKLADMETKREGELCS